jgi:competence protein ComEA
MNRKPNWIVPIGTLLVVVITLTLLTVPGAVADNSKTPMPVNINTADAGDLESLPGIGTSKANAIVNHRSEHGPFNTVDELTNVKGIGSNLLEKIRDLIMAQ